MSRLPAPENHPLPDIVADADYKGESEVDVASPISDIPVTAPVLENEPIVSKRELWSYYVRLYLIRCIISDLYSPILQLYYNGDNGVGPNGARNITLVALSRPRANLDIGYSMTLFQSLATSAGWDPVRGRGSSCLDADASGQCVLPWGSGTKSVSSVVLVANGVSFAVRISRSSGVIYVY